MTDAIVSIRNVTKAFPGVKAVDDANVDIRPNEFFALLGPSGCGKTTLLRMIAGFEMPTDGQILIDGEDVSDTPPNKRPVNMVFQSYAVFPHMSVADNVAYGLKVDGTPKGEIAGRVQEALEMVRLGEFGARKPDQLSGGQRQRVALARALVKRPKVLLLDEPLSALDAKLREQMQLELSRLQRDVGITFITVTHDQDEALSMADRIAVMEGGKVCQIATPEELYENPNSRFVADFIGKVNMLEGEVARSAEGLLSTEIKGVGPVEIPSARTLHGAVSLAIRPEKVRLSRDVPPGDGPRVEGRISDWAYYGDTSHIYVQTESGLRLSVTVQNETRETIEAFDLEDRVWLSWQSSDMLVLPD